MAMSEENPRRQESVVNVAGTPVMAAAPLAALDLPLKVLVCDDGDQTKVSYTAPGELATRYKQVGVNEQRRWR